MGPVAVGCPTVPTSNPISPSTWGAADCEVFAATVTRFFVANAFEQSIKIKVNEKKDKFDKRGSIFSEVFQSNLKDRILAMKEQQENHKGSVTDDSQKEFEIEQIMDEDINDNKMNSW